MTAVVASGGKGMSSTVSSRLNGVNCRSLKCGLPTGETLLQLTEPHARVIAKALDRSDLTVKAAASEMGISESLLARQLKGLEHLSWQRLNLLPDRFFCELLILLAETRGIATVRTQIQLERKAG